MTCSRNAVIGLHSYSPFEIKGFVYATSITLSMDQFVWGEKEQPPHPLSLLDQSAVHVPRRDEGRSRHDHQVQRTGQALCGIDRFPSITQRLLAKDVVAHILRVHVELQGTGLYLKLHFGSTAIALNKATSSKNALSRI